MFVVKFCLVVRVIFDLRCLWEWFDETPSYFRVLEIIRHTAIIGTYVSGHGGAAVFTKCHLVEKISNKATELLWSDEISPSRVELLKFKRQLFDTCYITSVGSTSPLALLEIETPFRDNLDHISNDDTLVIYSWMAVEYDIWRNHHWNQRQILTSKHAQRTMPHLLLAQCWWLVRP